MLIGLVSAHAAESTDLPLPRFVSLRADEANIRTGPGTRYPIQWVYRKQGLPVEIIEEYDAWRKIRDIEGTVGWVHQSLLEGARNAIITGKEPHLVRLDAEPGAKAILKVAPDVVVRVIECQLDWCQISVSGRKGWIEKIYLWGIYPKEIID
jgi:SH3-like domain-containing protein